MDDKNYLGHSVAATFGLILCLGLIAMVPEFDIGSFHFKRVNIFSDILDQDAGHRTHSADSIVIVKPVFEDTCRAGITCIEDFSPDTSGMTAFMSGLDSSQNQPVRIAFFADSYVEGDIMLDPFRDSMQSLYGGSGVGFVPITSEVAGFRQTIIHKFSNWSTYSIVGERSDEHPLGPAGLSFASRPGNMVEYKAPNHRHASSFPTSQLFYRNCTDCAVILGDNDSLPLTGTSYLNSIMLGKNRQSLKFSIASKEPVDLYGVSFEDTKGITVDNFSIRGNSGMGLNYVTENIYHRFNTIHPYRLVVLAYGLNVANQKAQNYTGYAKNMSSVVQRIKKAFPGSSIVIMGCSDRGAKVEGEYKTMPKLRELVEVQRQVAADNGVCFWDLFQAMGGDSTMVRWVDMKPPLANKDYTHLTFHGGKKVADILIGTLRYEKEKYDRKNSGYVRNVLERYYNSMQDEYFEANDCFAPHVMQYVTLKNTTPKEINKRNHSVKNEYLRPKTKIIDNKISYLRSEKGIVYYSFWISYSCYRKSMHKQEDCRIHIEVGFDTASKKMSSYAEKEIKDLKFS